MAALLGFAAVDCSVGSLLWFLRIACLLVTERDAEQLEVMAVMGLPSCCSLIHSLLPVARPTSLPPALIFPAGTERLSPRGTSALSGFWHLMTLDRCLFGTSVWHYLSLKALPFSSLFSSPLGSSDPLIKSSIFLDNQWITWHCVMFSLPFIVRNSQIINIKFNPVTYWRHLG